VQPTVKPWAKYATGKAGGWGVNNVAVSATAKQPLAMQKERATPCGAGG